MEKKQYVTDKATYKKKAIAKLLEIVLINLCACRWCITIFK